MKKLKVITSSPGLSGAGLISDYLLSRDDFVSPFKKKPDQDQQSEFRFVCDPGGLNSLYEGFYENFSINNASYVFYEFKKYLNNLRKLSIQKVGGNTKLYNKSFFLEAEKFQKKIIKIKYFGLPQYFRIGLSKKNKILWKILSNFKSAQEFKLLEMIVPVERKIFEKEAKIFINRVLKTLSKSNNKHIVIDQGANFLNPEKSTIFFSNKKIILITRDPRSIFSSMKTRKSLSYPGHNVNVFIKWFENIMKLRKKIKNRNIIILRYEDFILKHKKESKRLLNFLGLKDKKNYNFDILKSKKNIYKAKLNLTKYEINTIEKKLKKFLQWPKRN